MVLYSVKMYFRFVDYIFPLFVDGKGLVDVGMCYIYEFFSTLCTVEVRVCFSKIPKPQMKLELFLVFNRFISNCFFAGP